MATLNQLVARTAERMSMVGGTGIQLYGEDRIAEMIQHKFDILFDEAWWPQFMAWYQWTLDGSTGIVTTDLTDILKRFEDIRIIYPEDSNVSLTLLPTTINPFELGGTVPVHYEGSTNAARRFLVWPKAASGDIIVHVRIKPDTYTGDQTVDFDDQALILGATYDYLEDDGTNPAATDKFQGLFESRVQQLKKNLTQAPMALDPLTRLPSTFTFTALP